MRRHLPWLLLTLGCSTPATVLLRDAGHGASGDVASAPDAPSADVGVSADTGVSADAPSTDTGGLGDAPSTDTGVGADAGVCAAGLTACNGNCVDTQRNNGHCGGCGMRCGAGASCADGRCACPAGQTTCPEAGCVDLQRNAMHCGGCARACAAGQSCVEGRCTVACPTGRVACGGVCRDLQTDIAHCGACDNVCTAGLCSGGRCVPAASVQRSCLATPTPPGCGLVDIPGGTLTLGDAMALQASPTQPDVRVAGFVIDQYEVTVARFRAWWNASPTPRPSVAAGHVSYRGPSGLIQLPWEGPVQRMADLVISAGCTFGQQGREAHPITCVDWQTAQAFCVWDGGRLPTEAEWELAARGPEGRPFPWGTQRDLTRTCTNLGAGVTTTCAVDDPAYAMGATPAGVRHMVGNVWEWTADFYSNYSLTGAVGPCFNRSGLDNPLCTVSPPGQNGTRTTRGASYIERVDYESSVRAAARTNHAPFLFSTFLGFRCARDDRGS